MIIVTVCMMKNEEILAESAIRYWLEFSDFVIVYNHHSTDGTSNILNAMKEEFAERVVLYELKFSVGIEMVQKEITNAMIRDAFSIYHADLVLPLDTDEFPFLQNREKGSLRNYLESLEQSCCYSVHRIPYLLANDSDLDTSRFLPLSFTLTKKPLFLQTPKSIITGETYNVDPIYVVMGNHTLFRAGGNDLPPIVDLSPSMYYAHYPYQGTDQFKAKNAIGWLASYCNPEWSPGTSYHIQRCTDMIRKGTAITNEIVNWSVLSGFWTTDESLSDIQFEIVDPSRYFDNIPLRYTNQFMKKQDSFVQLIEQSLNLADQFKAQQKELKKSVALAAEKEALHLELERQNEYCTNLRHDAEIALQQNAQNKEQLADTKEYLTAVLASRSYRLGRAITWFPRKLRNAFHCYREHGFKYTVHRCFECLIWRK